MSEQLQPVDAFNSARTIACTEAILAKVGQARQQREDISVLSQADLNRLLTDDERSLVDAVYRIDPPAYGFKGPYLGKEPVPDDLVRVGPQPFSRHGKDGHTAVQFLPGHTYKAYQAMAHAIEHETGRRLLIESSYRSDAYQAVTFLSILKLYNYDIARTAARVAVPGYSEHGTPSQLALDLLNTAGLPTDETPQDFADTPEYEWLLGNAETYGFSLSYPRNNPMGVMYEPWHWRHRPSI